MHNVYIRPLREEDSKISYKWRNDPHIWTFTGSKPDKEITYEIETEWILKVLSDHTARRFAIIVDENYVGNIQLTNISSTSAEYHIFIGNKEYWGKGVAYLATYQILNYAKEELKLLNINLSVREDNIGAVKTYLKNGFEEVSNSDGWISMSVSLEKLPIPTVSIFCMVYNHEKYIAQCLDGFLFQKCNFTYTIILGEDCSKDSSRKVILEYVKNYPGKFKLLLHDENIGAHANQQIILENCNGKYIAICEGDDFWTDPNKLQKQIDFLENNKDYVLCGHNVDKLNFEGEIEVSKALSKPISFKQSQLHNTHIPTLSAVFRNKFDKIPEELKISPSGDFLIWSYLGQFGDFYLMNETMAIYRQHNGGTWSGVNMIKQTKNSAITRKLALNFVTDKSATIIFNAKLSKSGAYLSLKAFDMPHFLFFIKNYMTYMIQLKKFIW